VTEKVDLDRLRRRVAEVFPNEASSRLNTLNKYQQLVYFKRG